MVTVAIATAGSARFTLCGFGTETARTTTTVLAPKPLTINAVAGIATASLVGNDSITPTGTFYQIETFDAVGAALSVGKYRLSGTSTMEVV